MFRTIPTLVLALALAVPSALAQSTSASIAGIVTDSTKAVVK